jgi:2-phosphosulfolactate phosphatase
MVAVEVIRKSLLEGAQEASGTVVVIDVFRAFSCAPLLFRLGIKGLILEPDIKRALALKTGDHVVLLGERDERPIPGFDLGNSPSEIIRRGRGFFQDKTVIQRTTAGVQGVKAALKATNTVLLGSFLIARATAWFILHLAPPVKRITLVAMGIRGKRPAPEDEACADYIEHLLTAAPYEHMEAIERIVSHETAQKFLRSGRAYLPREDPIYCLQRDPFDFALLAEEKEGLIEVSKIPVAAEAL